MRTRGTVPDAVRIDVVLSRRAAIRTARDVAQAMVSLAGTQAIFTTSVLDRLLRERHHRQPARRGRAALMAEVAGALALASSPRVSWVPSSEPASSTLRPCTVSRRRGRRPDCASAAMSASLRPISRRISAVCWPSSGRASAVPTACRGSPPGWPPSSCRPARRARRRTRRRRGRQGRRRRRRGVLMATRNSSGSSAKIAAPLVEGLLSERRVEDGDELPGVMARSMAVRKRGSSTRSGRPMQRASGGQWRSGTRPTSQNRRPSPAW